MSKSVYQLTFRQTNPFVERSGDAQVVLMDNVKSRISVPIKNFKRTISGPVVKDDIFEILKSLNT